MPPEDFQYALLQVVPRIERGERMNAGVVLHSRRHGFLGARVKLDARRLRALDPSCDPDEVERHLRALVRVADGDPSAGRVAALAPWERFSWLVAPASTMIQPSDVHSGMTENPAATLDHLFERLVQ